MKPFTDFCEAWWYLEEHEMFVDPRFKGTKFAECSGLFPQCLEIEVHKVDPETCCISDDDSKNTRTEIWLECGEPYLDDFGYTRTNAHDTRFDCGGGTFEEAIINLANLVQKVQ